MRKFRFSPTFLAMIFAVFSLTVAGQTPSAILKSFTASAPDTVVQGEPFDVTYTLVAKTWDKGVPCLMGKNGFTVGDLRYEMKEGTPYHQLHLTAPCVTSRSGNVALPCLSMKIHQETVVSAVRNVFVKPNPIYGAEMTVANEWLLDKGQHSDSLCLKLSCTDKFFYVFHDVENGCFCIVAKKDVWPLVGQPVLAYSRECSIRGTGDMNYGWIVEPFRRQIEELQKTAVPTSPTAQPYTPRQHAQQPLLGNLRWNQNEPYNYYSPTRNGKRLIVGCVPLALAMAMNYYQWPERGQSHVYYQPDENLYRMDFSQCTPQWETYRTSYHRNDTLQVANLSKLLTSLGVSVDAKYDDGRTSASLSNLKHVLCNNLRYSGKIAHYRGLAADKMLSYLYRELDEQRPCIVSSGGHAFICDGYQDDFLHFNFGWSGHYTGYYRLKLGATQPAADAFMLKAVVGGIEPQREEPKSKEVEMKKAGMLADLLSEDEKMNLTALSVKGPINSTDIRLLRKMAGAVGELSFDTWQSGALRELDLSKATIVNDKEAYLTQKAMGKRFRTYQTVDSQGNVSGQRKYTFDFENMTESDWKEFKRVMGERYEDVYYTRTDDNKYWANYTCNKNEIGKYMFSDCSSLHGIILPEKTTKVDSYAFMGCECLQQIRLPQSVEEAGQTPFMNCVSLEKVEVPRGFIPKGKMCERCSPALSKLKIY